MELHATSITQQEVWVRGEWTKIGPVKISTAPGSIVAGEPMFRSRKLNICLPRLRCAVHYGFQCVYRFLRGDTLTRQCALQVYISSSTPFSQTMPFPLTCAVDACVGVLWPWSFEEAVTDAIFPFSTVLRSMFHWRVVYAMSCSEYNLFCSAVDCVDMMKRGQCTR